ncbi:hypothetical protein STPYR_12255 [uncultured Stenotrophomonas sp.]|uniref:Uncharacterized protein n=1 Tax=uncultured Stenotrophomonas sp. TaxID=165438 RepID=A0A1Y5Q8E6_9GAMM|nr:hypothetical protein STPYR_12255 [uncultured Stenotrophomonas sp.]
MIKHASLHWAGASQWLIPFNAKLTIDIMDFGLRI